MCLLLNPLLECLSRRCSISVVTFQIGSSQINGSESRKGRGRSRVGTVQTVLYVPECESSILFVAKEGLYLGVREVEGENVRAVGRFSLFEGETCRGSQVPT